MSSPNSSAPVSEETCATCRYWDMNPRSINGPPQIQTCDDEYPGYDDGFVRAGLCRRYPPRIVAPPEEWPGDYEGHFPIVGPVEWCGEWKRRPLPVVPPTPAAHPTTLDESLHANFVSKPQRMSYCHFSRFRRANITTLSEVLQMTSGDVLALKGVGPALLEEIRAWLRRYGLYLRGDEPAAPPLGGDK